MAITDPKSSPGSRPSHPLAPPPWAELLTDIQVGELLQISRRTVWKLTEDGLLTSLALGGVRRWRRRDILAFLDQLPSSKYGSRQ